jgi:hypothetical protein
VIKNVIEAPSQAFQTSLKCKAKGAAKKEQ